MAKHQKRHKHKKPASPELMGLQQQKLNIAKSRLEQQKAYRETEVGRATEPHNTLIGTIPPGEKFQNHSLTETWAAAQQIMREHPTQHVFQKFTCEKCGARLTMEEPDRFFETGGCADCGHTTDIRKAGCNYTVIDSTNPDRPALSMFDEAMRDTGSLGPNIRARATGSKPLPKGSAVAPGNIVPIWYGGGTPDREEPGRKQSHAERQRKVAVEFVLHVLAHMANPNNPCRLYCSANRPHADYPDCLDPFNVIGSAVENLAQVAKERPAIDGGPLSQHSKTDLGIIIGAYLVHMCNRTLREARIYQFTENDYNRLYQTIAVYSEAANGYTWAPYDKNNPPPEEETKQVCEWVVRHGAVVPFPEKLPFAACYLAWGAGVQIPPVVTSQYGLHTEKHKDELHLLMGTVLSADGWVFSLLATGTFHDHDGHRAATMDFGQPPHIIVERMGDYLEPDALKHNNTGLAVHSVLVEQINSSSDHTGEVLRGQSNWLLPFALTPWVVTLTTDILAKADTLVLGKASIKEKLDHKRISKRTGTNFLPKPYYTVLVQPHTLKEAEVRLRAMPRVWAYRWDVAAHDKHRLEQGDLPIDEKRYKNLLKRRYEFFNEMNPPHAEALAVMVRHKVAPPVPGRWVAYLSWRTKAFVKGPPDKPFIPATRRLQRRRQSPSLKEEDNQ